MQEQIDRLIETIRRAIEGIIEEGVRGRLLAAREALGVEPKGPGAPSKYPSSKKSKILAPDQPGRRAKGGWKGGKLTKAGGIVPQAERDAFVAAFAAAGRGKRAPLVKRAGISEQTAYKWLSDSLGGSGAAGPKKAAAKKPKPARSRWTDDQKRDIVSRGLILPPGERQAFLKDQGVGKTSWFKWNKWVKENPA